MKTVGIIGMGVMGGSFAGRLKQLGYRVYGFDLNGHSLKRAKEKEWIDEWICGFFPRLS